MDENVIEFLKGSETAAVTFTQGRYKSRVLELQKKFPDKVRILAENDDGSLLAHIPVEWIRINPTKQLSEEQRQQLADRARKYLGDASDQGS